jgi:hypothetical protein
VTLPLRASGQFTGTVVEVRVGAGDSPIDPGMVVISATGDASAAFASLASGDEIIIDLDVGPVWRDAINVVSGRESLVTGGGVDVSPPGTRNAGSPNPRTAIGITAAGTVVMATVDGRQAVSQGLRLPEMAELMVRLGAVQAINLDGGGSTALALRRPGMTDPAIVNQPSSVSRKVATALQVVSTAPTADLTAIAIIPGAHRMRAGETLQLSVGGHDASFNGVDPVLGPVAWSVEGDGASVSDDGLLTAIHPGNVVVRATAGGLSASAPISIVASVLTVGLAEPAFIADSRADLSAMPLRISWTLDSPRGAVRRVILESRVQGHPWKRAKLNGAAPTSHVMSFSFGRTYELRVRATDITGYRTIWSLGDPFTLTTYEGVNSGVRLSASWAVRHSVKAIGGDFLRSSLPGDSLQVEAAPAPFAVIGQRGANHGWAEVLMNGSSAGTVSLRRSSLAPRQVLIVGSADLVPELDTMAVEIRNVSSGGRTLVDVDAVVVIERPI